VLNTVRYVIVEHSLRRKGVETRIADEYCMLRIGSVENYCGHVFDPGVMPFGGIVGVFEKQEVHAVSSFAFGAAIFHREPFATLFEGQNVDVGGVEFFEKGYLFCLNGKIQLVDVERVFVIFVL